MSPSPFPLGRQFAILASLCLAHCFAPQPASVSASALRNSSIVKAVQNARPAVVNINGQKVVAGDDHYNKEASRRVNGMGTGVVIDPRGYILTNFHVVDGVRRIRVTLHNGQPYIAQLVSHDPATDLAIIRITVPQQMQVIPVGSSRDIMTGETVIAMGNAYGYEHTVTTGIVSAQHRSVQVNETQDYHDLIQTDASINPGNSGGPLLNIDGDMIGINVAVRVGAQGIGFAIPVDRAMQVAARLMSVERTSGVWHGLETTDEYEDDQLIVRVANVKKGSPADAAGLQPGDVIQAVNGQDVQRSLDLERALLGRKSGEAVDFALVRSDQSLKVDFAVATAPTAVSNPSSRSTTDLAWEALGVRLKVATATEVKSQSDHFRGGLRVTAIRAKSVAEQQGIQVDDILVGIHTWETISVENLAYIMSESDLSQTESIPFFVLRNQKTLAGNLPVSWLNNIK